MKALGAHCFSGSDSIFGAVYIGDFLAGGVSFQVVNGGEVIKVLNRAFQRCHILCANT